jgi:hypothetical protein
MKYLILIVLLVIGCEDVPRHPSKYPDAVKIGDCWCVTGEVKEVTQVSEEVGGGLLSHPRKTIYTIVKVRTNTATYVFDNQYSTLNPYFVFLKEGDKVQLAVSDNDHSIGDYNLCGNECVILED